AQTKNLSIKTSTSETVCVGSPIRPNAVASPDSRPALVSWAPLSKHAARPPKLSGMARCLTPVLSQTSPPFDGLSGLSSKVDINKINCFRIGNDTKKVVPGCFSGNRYEMRSHISPEEQPDAIDKNDT